MTEKVGLQCCVFQESVLTFVSCLMVDIHQSILGQIQYLAVLSLMQYSIANNRPIMFLSL